MNKKRHSKLLSKEELEQLIQHAIVDAYSEAEQKTGFCVMLEEHLALPFGTNVLGVEVSVETTQIPHEVHVALARGAEQPRLRSACNT